MSAQQRFFIWISRHSVYRSSIRSFGMGETANGIYWYDNRFDCFDISCYDRLILHRQMHLFDSEARSRNLCASSGADEFRNANIFTGKLKLCIVAR